MENETYAYFTIEGSGDHNRISKIISIQPSSAFTEGTLIPGRSTKYGATKWRIDSTLDKNCPLHDCLEDHVENVVNQIEKIKDELDLLGPEYEKYIQCIAYYEGSNLGLGLSNGLLQRIATLNVGIDFDLYSLLDNYSLRNIDFHWTARAMPPVTPGVWNQKKWQFMNHCRRM